MIEFLYFFGYLSSSHESITFVILEGLLCRVKDLILVITLVLIRRLLLLMLDGRVNMIIVAVIIIAMILSNIFLRLIGPDMLLEMMLLLL
jgi:hypothetical protein